MWKLRKRPTEGAPAAVAIVQTPPVTGSVGQDYAGLFVADGGTAPYTWSLDSGAVPGLTLHPTSGAFTGVPEEEGPFDLVVRVTDAVSGTDTVEVQVVIAADAEEPVPLGILTATVRAAEQGVSYTFTFREVAGSGSGSGYTWDVTAGTLPEGLSLSTGGVLSGTPTTLESQAVTIRLRDGALASETREYTIDVVEEVDEFAYFDFWAAHPKLHNTGFPAIPHDSPQNGVAWAAYRMAGETAGGLIATTSGNGQSALTYSASDTPPTIKLTIAEGTVKPGGNKQNGIPFCGNDPGLHDHVIVWDELYDSSWITAQEAEPSLTSDAIVNTYKFTQCGRNYAAGGGRWLEHRTRFDRRNLPSDGEEASPNRRVLRFDWRIYDDANSRVIPRPTPSAGNVTPQYMLDANMSPTGRYAEPAGVIPAYENMWVRHIVQIRQYRPGSSFTDWSHAATNGADTNGIPENEISVSIAVQGSGPWIAVVTQADHPYVVGDLVRVRFATEAVFNGLVRVTARTTATWSYALPSNPGVSAASGPVMAGTGYSEVSWWVLNQDGGSGGIPGSCRCVAWKAPVYQQSQGLRKWWREQDTSTSEDHVPVFEMVRSGQAVTFRVGTTTPIAITSIVMDPTPVSGKTGNEAWKNGMYAGLVTTAAPHGLPSHATNNRWVSQAGMDQGAYNGDFGVHYYAAASGGPHSPTQYTLFLPSPEVDATGSAKRMVQQEDLAYTTDGQSMRISGATGGSTGFNGDFRISGGARGCPSGTFGSAAGPRNIVTYTLPSGTPTSPAEGAIEMMHALLNPTYTFFRGLFVLEDYDSPGAAPGAGVLDPVSAAALGTPSAYDTDLFQLPKY